ncbi:M20 metallopeptidase family protein [Alkalibacter mobilis]|uniref:M20 metallopeptidase family protein n=1 Tax=Alkalibacter mobilis TaxID=2787712 RepID=UPI00189DCAE8|nr:amidohydrolase [Alkalibacter mobilis]MBF7097735.1 amidohydrolase [Alkalibacter mobilis]
MKLRKEIVGLKEDSIKIRRTLHTFPEEGFKEFKTSNYIKDYLVSLGLVAGTVAQTGVYSFIEGENTHRCIAFRADMDGLSVCENTGVEFKSEHESMMHACGHDGHMTILLLLAKYLTQSNLKPKCNILLIFQPAEEGPGGAKQIVDEGLLTKYQVNEIYGTHLMPSVNEGVISVRSGAMMAQTGEVYIEIKGKSSHGAAPHQGTDAVVIAAGFIQALQTIVSRNVNPIKTSLISIGTISGGERLNVVAKSVKLAGTMRSYEEKVYEDMKSRVIEIAEGFQVAFNCDIKCDFIDMYPPVTNDVKLYDKFIELMDKDEYEEAEPLMIAEDFSFYQKTIPGLFFYLGSKNEIKNFTYGLHDSKFNFDEEILLNGVEIYARIIDRESTFN